MSLIDVRHILLSCLYQNIEVLKRKKKITIGRKDKANFPELGLADIDIKMDTGAYTSAIHCHTIEVRIIGGKNTLIFSPLDPTHNEYKKRELSTTKFKEKHIKNSGGSSERRYIIETDILLFGKKYPIQLSLSKRGEMRFPVLIGRRFLIGKFVVDSARYNLSYRMKLKELNAK